MATELLETTVETARRKGTSLTLAELCQRAGRKADIPRILALDPGDTTGWVVMQGAELRRADVMPGTVINMHDLIKAAKPDVVVIEEYVIYGWKASEHAWSDVPVLRLIGAVELTCALLGIPLVKQSPKNVKPFCADDKLKGWGLWQGTGDQRHANDAIRHAAYFALFGKMPTKAETAQQGHTVEPSRLNQRKAGRK